MKIVTVKTVVGRDLRTERTAVIHRDEDIDVVYEVLEKLTGERYII